MYKTKPSSSLELPKRRKSHHRPETHLKWAMLLERPLHIDILEPFLQLVHREDIVPLRRSPLYS